MTEDNVDLNRNLKDFGQPLPENPAYEQFHALLVPETWPPPADNRSAMAALVEARGVAFTQAAISGGQYRFDDGLFYGGRAPTWSHRAVRAMLREHLAGAAQMGWIDLHTGLGPAGHGERIFSPGGGDYRRACRWWSGGGRTPVTRADHGTAVAAELSGSLEAAAGQECSGTALAMIALEFGTLPPLDVLDALRADQWLMRHPEADTGLRRRIKQQLLDAFFVDTREWQAAVLAQGLEAIEQAIAGLAQEPVAAGAPQAPPALRPAA